MNKIITLISITLLSACTALPTPQSPISIHDFGVPPSLSINTPPDQISQVPKSVLIADAATASWLNTTAIHYRLLYHNPTQTYTYANSRWVAAPADLLTRHVRNRIATATTEQVTHDFGVAKTDYVLHIELEELTQLFTSATDSRIEIGFRASLVDRNNRKLLAQKNFVRTEIAPTADAAGAVTAFSSATFYLINELVDWLQAELLHRK